MLGRCRGGFEQALPFALQGSKASGAALRRRGCWAAAGWVPARMESVRETREDNAMGDKILQVCG